MSTADGSEFHTPTANGDNVIRITADGNVVYRALPIDNFEHNALSDYYEPASSGASTSTAAAFGGSYGLDFPETATGETVSMPNELQVSGQTASLDNHLQQGDSATVWFNLQTWDVSSSYLDISFAHQWQDIADDQLRISFSNNDPDIDLELIEVAQGSTSPMDSATWSSHTTGDWYGFDLVWAQNGEISADLIDADRSTILSLGPASPQLTGIRGGGVTWWTSSNTGAYFDEWTISNRSDSTEYGSWWFSAPSDETSQTTAFQGVVFEPLTTLSGVGAWLDWSAGGFTRALLYEWDPSAGTTTVVENVDISSLSGGDWFTIPHSFDPAIDYLLGIDAGGNQYTRARGNFSRPTDSEDFAITNGVYNDNPSTPAGEYRYNIRTIRAIQ